MKEIRWCIHLRTATYGKYGTYLIQWGTCHTWRETDGAAQTPDQHSVRQKTALTGSNCSYNVSSSFSRSRSFWLQRCISSTRNMHLLTSMLSKHIHYEKPITMIFHHTLPTPVSSSSAPEGWHALHSFSISLHKLTPIVLKRAWSLWWD